MRLIRFKNLKRSGATVASLAPEILAVATQQNSSPSLRNRFSRSSLILSPKLRSIKGGGWPEPKALTPTFNINFSLTYIGFFVRENNYKYTYIASNTWTIFKKPNLGSLGV
jgi:hypothetical protein